MVVELVVVASAGPGGVRDADGDDVVQACYGEEGRKREGGVRM